MSLLWGLICIVNSRHRAYCFGWNISALRASDESLKRTILHNTMSTYWIYCTFCCAFIVSTAFKAHRANIIQLEVEFSGSQIDSREADLVRLAINLSSAPITLAKYLIYYSLLFLLYKTYWKYIEFLYL